VRHRRRALVAGRKRLLGFAHLGPLEVSDLCCDLFQRTADAGQDADEKRVAVALDDLRRGGRGTETKLGADLVLEIHRDVGMGPNGAGQFADRHVFARQVEPPPMPSQLVEPDGQLETERRRFRMDTVRPPDHDRVPIPDCLRPDHVDQTAKLFIEQIARVLDL
jgi:hypothetical protein